jgi:hypothetical protein
MASYTITNTLSGLCLGTYVAESAAAALDALAPPHAETAWQRGRCETWAHLDPRPLRCADPGQDGEPPDVRCRAVP